MLTQTPALKEHVEKFAESSSEFHEEFKSGFVKLVDHGHSSLHDVERFLDDDVNSKLRFRNNFA